MQARLDETIARGLGLSVPRPRTLAPLALILGCSLVACDDTPTRVWQPTDHSQPPGLGNTPAPAASTPPSSEVAGARAGAALFRAHCASCHGVEGRGDGPSAPPMARPADLTAVAWQTSRTDAQITEAIRLGRGAMPGFGDRIQQAGITALVAHVRSLGARPPSP